MPVWVIIEIKPALSGERYDRNQDHQTQFVRRIQTHHRVCQTRHIVCREDSAPNWRGRSMRRRRSPPTDTNALGGAYMMGRAEDELCKFIFFSLVLRFFRGIITGFVRWRSWGSSKYSRDTWSRGTCPEISEIRGFYKRNGILREGDHAPTE